MRTLVLDDDPVFLEVAEGALASLGCDDVTSRLEGAEALRLLREAAKPFELIILDLNMPALDGLAFLRALAEMRFDGLVAIITGEKDVIRASALHIARSLGLRVLGGLGKPLQIDRLADILAAARSTWGAHGGEADGGAGADGRAGADSIRPMLCYQPQVDLLTGKIFGAEALLRTVTPTEKVLGPEMLLLVNDTPEKRFDLTRTLFSALCRDLATLQAMGFRRRLSFNVDALVFEYPDLVAMLKTNVGEHGADPRLITLELTESQLPADKSMLLEVIARLGMAGFEVSMDDFGTGASNYELLRHGAFSELKLDHTIVQSAFSDPVGEDFLHYAVNLARSLGTRVVAEGAETVELVQHLQRIGLRYAQGFHFGKPDSFDRLVAMVEAESGREKTTG